MHSVSKIQRFRMLQLMVHCSKHCAFKGLVTITEPGGICHTCHACIYIQSSPSGSLILYACLSGKTSTCSFVFQSLVSQYFHLQNICMDRNNIWQLLKQYDFINQTYFQPRVCFSSSQLKLYAVCVMVLCVQMFCHPQE